MECGFESHAGYLAHRSIAISVQTADFRRHRLKSHHGVYSTFPVNIPERDPYSEKPYYRWLALTAALLAWGFDGVEQGVFALMTRAALKELIPGGAPTEGQISFYFSLSMAMWLWGAAVGGVWFGRMGDQFGRVRTLIFAVITYSIFTAFEQPRAGRPSGTSSSICSITEAGT